MFSVVELRLFRYTAVLFCLVTIFALLAAIVWASASLLDTFYNLLLSLALAGVLALVLHPVAEFLERRLRLPHLLAVIVLMLAFMLCIAAFVGFLVPVVVSQGMQLMRVLPDTLADGQAYFAFHFPEISDMLARRDGTDDGKATAPDLPGIERTGTTIMSYVGVLAGLSFVPLFLFFTLLSGNRLREKASELLSIFRPNTRQKTLYFIEVFVEYVTAFFQGQLIIAVGMGALYAIGFTLVGLKFGVLVGLVLGLLNIIPFLGSMIGLIVVLPMAYLQPEGGLELLALTALVFAAVQLSESWLMTPKIMANRSGLHPALVVISLFFWGTALDGIIGMVLAVPLTAFLVAIWSEIKNSLRQTLSPHDPGHG